MTKLTMVLAQSPQSPDGDVTHRLNVHLRLTSQGQIDLHAWETDPAPGLATRERPGYAPRRGEVIRLDEGWALQSLSSEDDPLWSFEGHLFRPGELVRVGRPNGEELLFRIVAADPD